LIQNLARPFNEPQQLELLGQTGVVTGLWTARIKTHCYVLYEDKQQAWATLKALQGISWPKGNKKSLAVKFVPEEVAKEAIETQMDPVSSVRAGAGTAAGSAGARSGAATTAAAGAGRDVVAVASGGGGAAAKASGAPSAVGQGGKPSVLDRLGDRVHSNDSREERGTLGRQGKQEAAAAVPAAEAEEQAPRRGRKVQQQDEQRSLPPTEDKGMVTLDELFRSTKVAKPMLYWLPLSDEEVAAKKAQRAAVEGGAGAYKEPIGSAVQEGLPPVHTNR
jgi:apoptotic chromatin condensation inducer in the nucleus